MSVASILCVDGEVDIHDTARGAVAAALDRRTDTTRIGISTGDIELGDPLGLANRLAAIARPGQLLMSDAVRRSIARDHHELFDLGAVSLGSRVDRIHVFELGGARTRTRTAFAIDLAPHNKLSTDEDTLDGELQAYDQLILKHALRHGGFLDRTAGTEMMFAFADLAGALVAAKEIDTAWHSALSHVGNLRCAVAIADMHYYGDRWFSSAWDIVERVLSFSQFRQVVITDAVLAAAGEAGLAAFGLGAVSPREEVILKGRRDAVGVHRVALRD
jgi:class 3 adenylate cyclase